MSYSIDLRERVIAFVSGGSDQVEASRIFGISRRTIYKWLRRSDLSDPPRKLYASKLNKASLEAHIRDYPDALLRERAAHFGVRPNTIWYALKRLDIVKKNDTLR
jgi:transposase